MVGGVEQELEYPRINCTLSGLDQLANTNTNYITIADVLPHIPASGLMSTALLDEDDELTGIEYGLISSFYNTLSTIVDGRTSCKILSSNASNELVWA